MATINDAIQFFEESTSSLRFLSLYGDSPPTDRQGRLAYLRDAETHAQKAFGVLQAIGVSKEAWQQVGVEDVDVEGFFSGWIRTAFLMSGEHAQDYHLSMQDVLSQIKAYDLTFGSGPVDDQARAKTRNSETIDNYFRIGGELLRDVDHVGEIHQNALKAGVTLDDVALDYTAKCQRQAKNTKDGILEAAKTMGRADIVRKYSS